MFFIGTFLHSTFPIENAQFVLLEEEEMVDGFLVSALFQIGISLNM